MAAKIFGGSADRGALDRWSNEGGAPAADTLYGRRLTETASATAAECLLGIPASRPHASGVPVFGIGRPPVADRKPMDDRTMRSLT